MPDELSISEDRHRVMLHWLARNRYVVNRQVAAGLNSSKNEGSFDLGFFVFAGNAETGRWARIGYIEPEEAAALADVNDELERVYGWELHDLYKAQHPINRHTALEYVGNNSVEKHLYRIHEPVKVFDEVDAIAPALSKGKIGMAAFENWGVNGRLAAELAFAPEINTIFIRGESHAGR